MTLFHHLLKSVYVQLHTHHGLVYGGRLTVETSELIRTGVMKLLIYVMLSWS